MIAYFEEAQIVSFREEICCKFQSYPCPSGPFGDHATQGKERAFKMMGGILILRASIQ